MSKRPTTPLHGFLAACISAACLVVVPTAAGAMLVTARPPADFDSAYSLQSTAFLSRSDDSDSWPTLNTSYLAETCANDPVNGIDPLGLAGGTSGAPEVTEDFVERDIPEFGTPESGLLLAMGEAEAAAAAEGKAVANLLNYFRDKLPLLTQQARADLDRMAPPSGPFPKFLVPAKSSAAKTAQARSYLEYAALQRTRVATAESLLLKQTNPRQYAQQEKIGNAIQNSLATPTHTQLEFPLAGGAKFQPRGITAVGERFVRVAATPERLNFTFDKSSGALPGTFAIPEATFKTIGHDPTALKNLLDLPGAAPVYFRVLEPSAGTTIQRGIVPGGEFGGVGRVPEVLFPEGI